MRYRADSNVPRRAIERPARSTVARARRGNPAIPSGTPPIRRRAAPAMARLALTACLTASIHSAPANDYPPPPGPYQIEPGALPGASPSVRVRRQSAEAVSAPPEGSARILATGSSGHETTRGRYDASARSGSTPRRGATERFRPAAATEYSQPPVLPRAAATPGSPGRAYSASNRPAHPVDTSAASATGDAGVGNSASAFRTDLPRSPVDRGEPARGMPDTPVFRPPDATGR